MTDRSEPGTDNDPSDAVIQWLDDRSQFHSWFTTLITGSFVLFVIFGDDPGFERPGQLFVSIALGLLIFAMICNLCSVWSIPSWKFRIRANGYDNWNRIRLELSINAWVGVICFVSGLTLGFIARILG